MKHILVALCLLLAFGPQHLAAMPAHGTNAYIEVMQDLGLFNAHPNHCDSSTEAFVVVHSGAIDRGFCIEKNERTAASFEVALKACLDEGKRLPEPLEFKVACNDATTLGLNDMTDGDYEWSSNFVDNVFKDENGSGHAVAALGGTQCTHSTFRSLAWNPPYLSLYPTTAVYRCVR